VGNEQAKFVYMLLQDEAISNILPQFSIANSIIVSEKMNKKET